MELLVEIFLNYNLKLNFFIQIVNNCADYNFLVYPDGTVCISILHPPGKDEFNEME